MKRALTILMAATLALGFYACAGKTPTGNTEPTEPTETAEPAETTEDAAPVWTWETRTSETAYTAEDGTEVARRRYELPYLTYSGSETAERDAVRDTFNDAMDQVVADSEQLDLEEVGRENYAWSTETGIEFIPCLDEFSATDVYQNGALLSVSGVGSSMTGGAHPTNYLMAWNYDLDEGRFFTLSDLSDDPAALRAAIAEDILAQIDAEGNADWYFPEYQDTVRGMEDFNVFFDAEGMTVWFSEYDIAPHAAGIPTFRISADTLAPHLNAYARQLLS